MNLEVFEKHDIQKHPAAKCINPLVSLPQVALSSDEAVFGGYVNISKDSDVTMLAEDGMLDGRPHSLKVGDRTGVIRASIFELTSTLIGMCIIGAPSQW